MESEFLEINFKSDFVDNGLHGNKFSQKRPFIIICKPNKQTKITTTLKSLHGILFQI